MHYFVSFYFCNHLNEEEREVVAFLLLSFRCLVTVDVLWLFSMLLCVGSQFVIMVFPDHTHLLFDIAPKVQMYLGYVFAPLTSCFIFELVIFTLWKRETKIICLLWEYFVLLCCSVSCFCV